MDGKGEKFADSGETADRTRGGSVTSGEAADDSGEQHGGPTGSRGNGGPRGSNTGEHKEKRGWRAGGSIQPRFSVRA
ncbi:hypothetical protein GCM10017557_29810 [Streptomyces aurantiacus]|uniref:Uncharacterized protein n=1 Tax=Streptomyces aurantiacus TaxID=47760 RepID=A0A7G1NZL3_9ACTN|nr:hypothetical protein GCM10017557_29810 [Streptomyces aurantiacus]